MPVLTTISQINKWLKCLFTRIIRLNTLLVRQKLLLSVELNNYLCLYVKVKEVPVLGTMFIVYMIIFVHLHESVAEMIGRACWLWTRRERSCNTVHIIMYWNWFRRTIFGVIARGFTIFFRRRMSIVYYITEHAVRKHRVRYFSRKFLLQF
jgi:hypothetical protein